MSGATRRLRLAARTPEQRNHRHGWRAGRGAQCVSSLCTAALVLLALFAQTGPVHAQDEAASEPLTPSSYAELLDRLQSLDAYNRHLSRLVDSQVAEISEMEGDLETIDQLRRDLPTLMEKMVESLAEFVELDIPFDIDERRERIASLRKDLASARLSQPDKYRRIAEAYQIENDYGRSIDAYRSTIESEGRERAVDLLRVGRVALIYQTLDESEAAVWDNDAREWEPLSSSTRTAIRRGLRVARKQAAPELLTLPFPVAEAAGDQP